MIRGERGPVQTVRGLLARLSPYAARKAQAVVEREKRPEHVEHVKEECGVRGRSRP